MNQCTANPSKWPIVDGLLYRGTLMALLVSISAVAVSEVSAPPSLGRTGQVVQASSDGPISIDQALDRFDRVQVIVVVDAGSNQAPSVSQSLRSGAVSPFASKQAEVADRLESLGLRVKRRFKTIPALVTQVDRQSLRALRSTPGVVDVIVDEAYPPTLNGTIPIIEADTLHGLGIDGTGYAVAILDTGVDRAHPMFEDGNGGSRVVAEACFSTNGTSANSLCPTGAETEIGVGAGVHCVGIGGCDHGTHVAGIAAGSAVTTGGGTNIVGVAPGADIVAIQVFTEFTDSASCGGSPPCVLSYNSDQIAGLEWLGTLDQSQGGSLQVASANMSLGGGQYTSNCFSQSYNTGGAIDALWSIGIATVIATGNNGWSDSISSPACYPKAIAVGATTDSDLVASYSNAAPDLVDIYAPGSSVLAAIPNGSYGYKSGTSMATPHVAGAWALMRQAGAGDGAGSGIEATLQIFQDTGLSVSARENAGELGYSHPRMNVNAAVERLNSTDSWLNVSISGQGSVSSDPVGIDCGTTCAMVIQVGDSIELTATPSTGFVLSEWTGCDSVASNVCTVDVAVEENRSVSASFWIEPPVNDDLAAAIEIVSNPWTTSVSTVGATYELGEPLPDCDSTGGRSVWYRWTTPDDGKLREASADTLGSDFDTVLDVLTESGGDPIGASIACDIGTPEGDWLDSTVSFLADPNQTYYLRISAYFGLGGDAVLNWSFRSSYTLTAITSGLGEGTITSVAGIDCGTSTTDCEAEVLVGATVTLIASPGPRSMLAEWAGACAGTPATEPCSVEMTSDMAVEAIFEINPVIFHNRFGEMTPE